MNRKLIAIALLLLFANFVYAEEQQANFLVIEGNSRVSNEEIVEYSGFEVGKIYNSEDISNIITINENRLSYGVSVTDINSDGDYEFIVAGFGYPN